MSKDQKRNDLDRVRQGDPLQSTTSGSRFSVFFFYSALWCLSCLIMLFLGDLEGLKVLDEWRFKTQDDHMITMRVAANFAETLKPFFNKGEAVAANTSLFWPMILSTAYGLFDHQSFVLFIFGLSVALSATFIVTAATLINHRFLQLFVVVCLTLSPSVLRYGVSGWEHIPQSFFVTIALVRVFHASLESDTLKIPMDAFVLMGLSFVFRPDSAVLIAVLGLVWILHDRRFADPKSVAVAGLMLLLPIGYLLLMNHYYGELVPNTAHLKVLTFSEGLSYGFDYVTDRRKTWLFPYLLIILMLVPQKSAFTKFVIVLGVTQLLYTILIGGDVFSYGRFYLLLLPITVAVLFAELLRLRNFRLGQYLILSIVPYLSLGTYAVITVAATALSFSIGSDRETGTLGHLRAAAFFNCALDPNEGSIGLHVLGTGYQLMDFHVVDFLGKAEPIIAKSEPKYGVIGHNKWDYPYIFSTYSIQGFPAFEEVVQSYRSGSEEFRIHNWSFMYAAVDYFETKTDYVYIPAEQLAGKTTGVYLRPELVQSDETQACLNSLRNDAGSTW